MQSVERVELVERLSKNRDKFKYRDVGHQAITISPTVLHDRLYDPK